MTTPPVGVRGCDQLGLNRLEVNVSDHTRQIWLRFHDNRLIPPSKHGAIPAMRAIKPLGIEAIDMAHHAAYIGRRGAQTQMILILHQTIREDLHTPQGMGLRQHLEKQLVISSGPKGRQRQARLSARRTSCRQILRADASLVHVEGEREDLGS